MEHPRWDDDELVRRCKDGQEAAYAELVRRHRPRLYNLAYRLTNDRAAAEDVVQETFLSAFRAIERFEPRPSLAAWLNRIAIRAAARVTDARSAGRRLSLDGLLDRSSGDGNGRDLVARLADLAPGVDPHALAEAAELRRELNAAIAALPFKYRAAIVLRYVTGLDYAEAAATLGVPLNTFKSHLLRATRMLRERLAPQLAPTLPLSAVAPPEAVVAASADHGLRPRTERVLLADEG